MFVCLFVCLFVDIDSVFLPVPCDLMVQEHKEVKDVRIDVSELTMVKRVKDGAEEGRQRTGRYLALSFLPMDFGFFSDM